MLAHGAVLTVMGQQRPYAVSRPLTVHEVHLAEPGPTEVLLRIEAAGLCHSDLSVVDGGRPRPMPMLLGHEASGRVLAVGDAVTAVTPGRRVVLSYLPACGECVGCRSDGRRPCVPGSAANANGELLSGGRRIRLGRGDGTGEQVNHHLGVSAFATHAVVDERSVVPVDDDVPPDVAALMGCAVLTGGGAVTNAGGVRPGESVAVVGLGGVGCAALLVARAVGASRVVAVDVHPDKRALALALGADDALTPDEATGIDADCVVEAAGVGTAVRTAISATGPGGRTVLVGLPRPGTRVEIDPLAMVAGGMSVIGSYLGSSVPRRDVPRYLDLWRAGRLPVERLISNRIGLDDLNEALDALADARVVRQIVLPHG
ncbi:zinc-binding dehydrogenase [Lapillicoccus sp.]|uniref:zinc-binding dehydrogenase n=1 Tax=Lapillicoccus sp. TaxID=1909287 RepID=UPI0027C6B957|nr:alcohol dehydrogenase catalytic domain-containing protein [Actinomycetota bacterium]